MDFSPRSETEIASRPYDDTTIITAARVLDNGILYFHMESIDPKDDPAPADGDIGTANPRDCRTQAKINFDESGSKMHDMGLIFR